MLWVLVLGAILIWAPPPTITHRTGVVRAQIKPKPCSVNGVEGTCMFVYECIKTEGKHVGMCVDNFMFGSCCSHNITQNAIIPHHQSNPNVLYSSNNIYSSPRPPNLILSARPQSSSSKLRPSKPVSFVTHPTKRPPTSQQWLREPSTTATTSQKQLTIAKPWTNKPPSFVTSADSNLKPSFPQTKFPNAVGSNSSSVVTQSLLIVPVNSSLANKHPSSVTAATTSSYISAYDLIATSRPSPSANITSTTKTPNSFYVSSTTSTSTETTPSTWSTSKPSWLGSPTANNIFASSKPLLQHSKPDYWSSEKPTFITNQASWTATTEPHFVTRPRPSSNLWSRPKPTRKPITLLGLGLSSTRSNLTTSDTNSSAGQTTTTTTTSTTTTSTTTSTTTTTTSTSSSTSTSTTESPDVTTNRSAETTTEFSKISNYQYSGQCGVAALSPRPEMRIVGGKNAPFGGWPWQVSVRRTSFFGFSSTHRCGGAVINENWIATAGHCVDDLLTSQIRIRVGEYDFSSVTEPYPFVERAVSKKVVHPKYNFFTYEYDLALVRLESALEFQPHISPICLPASDDLLIGENATVTGWGRLSEGGTLPSVLQQSKWLLHKVLPKRGVLPIDFIHSQRYGYHTLGNTGLEPLLVDCSTLSDKEQVSVPIVSNDKCKSMFLRAGRHEFIPEIFLCAGYENGGQDSCQGDSGGPLQVKGKNGRYFLAGIISWGIGCAEANLPGVCTRISKFVPWILENVT